MKLYKKFKILLLLLIFSGFGSQTINPEFDSLIINKPLEMFNNNIPAKKRIEWNLKMLEKAKKENYQKGITWAHINLGVDYYLITKLDLSIKHLNIAKKLADKTSADNETYAKLYLEFSQAYFTLGLYDLSLKYNSKAMYFAKKINNSHYKKSFLSDVYSYRSLSIPVNQTDSTLYYLHCKSSAKCGLV